MSEREDDPWKDIEAELLRNIGYPLVTVADLRADTFVARFFAARAAEATQHQQEIAAKDAIIKQQAADLKLGGEMQDREIAQWKLAALLKDRTRREIREQVRAGQSVAVVAFTYGVPDEFVKVVSSWQMFEDDAIASPLSAPPQEPTGASPQAETSEDEDDVPAVDSWSAPLRKPVVPKILSTDDFYALLRILEVLPVADPFLTGLQAKLSDEERRQHGNRASHLSGPEFVREIERIEALIQSRLPAPVSPVEPTPEPEPRMAFCDACVTAAHCNHHWRCLAECTPSDLKVKTNPCVWRITTGPLGTWVKPSCVEGSIPAPWGTERAKSCHLCGSPLRLVPAEEK